MMERGVIIILTLLAVCLAIHQLFNLQAFGVVLLEAHYLYLIAGMFLALIFLCSRGNGSARKEPVMASKYDWLLALLALSVCAYFADTAATSLDAGWEYAPPTVARYLSLLLYLLILEATRRAGGLVLFFIVLFFSLYPTFADEMPNPLNGFRQPFWDTIPYHIISSESSFGIPMKSFGNLVIGFIIFGTVLQRTGGGLFFNNLALALVGRFRGGAAKVSIFASGFMGSMSGSVISNVLTTGAVSIPAMKKTGFEPRYAAATESCASTGGVLMPPIMGATAFVMASFLSRPYVEIALAAAIPSLLFYFGLFAQIDAYAARRGLRGLSAGEVPSTIATLRAGWPFLVVFVLLIYLMVGKRLDTQAPFWATALLLMINQFVRQFRFNLSGIGDLIIAVGRSLAELTAVLLGVGLIVGAFSATGLAGTLVNDLVFLAGDSVLALLVMGALTAFIFGMGMTVTACYIFLAIVLAPALEQVGLNQLAVHLFILYWGMVSYITPPVALGAFAAANIAEASPLRTGVEAMRLGGVIYIAPFFFVLNPALVGEGSLWEIITTLATALIGIFFISGSLQGHISYVGGFGKNASGLFLRIMLFTAGFMFALPGNELMGFGHWQLSGIGLILAVFPMGFAWIKYREKDIFNIESI